MYTLNNIRIFAIVERTTNFKLLIIMNLQEIKETKLYKKVLKNSFGGVMYNVDDLEDYKKDVEYTTLTDFYNKMKPYDKECLNGIEKGVLSFLVGR